MAFRASSSLSSSARFLTSAMNCSSFMRGDPSFRVLGVILKHEGDLEVDLVALDVALLDHDVLIFDPGALYVPQRLGGPGYGLLDGILEALLRDGADLCYPCDAHTLESPLLSDARSLMLMYWLPPLRGA